MNNDAKAVVPKVLETGTNNEDNKTKANTITNVTQDNEVIQSNALVEGYYSLTDVEQRVLFALIAGLDQDGKSLEPVTVRIKSIADACGISQKNAYTQLDAVFDKLVTKAVIYKTKDRNGKRQSKRHPWFAKLDNKEVTGVVIYKFHEELTHELLELKRLNSGWVSMTQGTVAKLESAYAIRFYALFLKWSKIGHVSLTIDQIVNLFALQGKYIDKRTKKLNKTIMLQRVVYPALERINSITNMKVGCEIQKVGKSTTGITFRFRLNEQEPPEKINVPELEENKDWRLRPSVANICNRLYSHGYKKELFNKILDKYDNEDDFKLAVGVALDELTSAQLSGKIVNSGAFLYRKIMDYDPEQQKMFAAEAEAEKRKEMERTKQRTASISNARAWEDIIDLASRQATKEDAIKILEDGAAQRPEILEKFKEAFKRTYPNDAYDIGMEISRLRIYGIAEIKKTPKVDYSLTKSDNQE